MKISTVSRYALSVCAAAMLLAGCGGAQSPIGAPGAMPQSRTTATQVEQSQSWMLPGAKSENLLYVASTYGGGVSSAGYQDAVVSVYTYPRGENRGSWTEKHSSTWGECADTAGDVFVTLDAKSGKIVEFAHGGRRPIKTLPDPSGVPFACSVDPTTGNLAVVNDPYRSHHTGVLLIYHGASGTPQRTASETSPFTTSVTTTKATFSSPTLRRGRSRGASQRWQLFQKYHAGQDHQISR